MNPGEDKLWWGYGKKYSFAMKESYDILTAANIQPKNKKGKNYGRRNCGPKYCFQLASDTKGIVLF